MSARVRRHYGQQAGFSLVELLISTAIMLVVTGSIFRMMNPAQGNAQAQPEMTDMQQRMRVGTDALFKELIIAGAGPYQGPVTGSLIGFFAPIVPRRVGDRGQIRPPGRAASRTIASRSPTFPTATRRRQSARRCRPTRPS